MSKRHTVTCEHCHSPDLVQYEYEEDLCRSIKSTWRCKKCAWTTIVIYKVDRTKCCSSPPQ